MILTDLLDRPVRDEAGRRLGYVIDARFVLDGPPDGLLAAARLHGLVVSPRTRTSFLGYERASSRSPWLVAWVLRRWHRGTFLVLWADVADVGPAGVRLRPDHRRWSPQLRGR